MYAIRSNGLWVIRYLNANGEVNEVAGKDLVATVALLFRSYNYV